MKISKWKAGLALAVVGAVGYGAWIAFDWTVNRHYAENGESLMVRYKGSLFGTTPANAPGQFAKKGEKGVRPDLLGPGRHWRSPILWEVTRVPDTVIRSGQVGIVTCKLGDDLPDGQFLVDGDLDSTKYKGVLRKVLHPGSYRIHPYAYEVQVVATQTISSGNSQKHAGWVEIPTGYVGVVTNEADNPLTGAIKGIQDDVLPPGIYPINGREQKVDIVEIGYRQSTLQVAKRRDGQGNVIKDENGEPQIANNNTGIEFPSRDGFPMLIDYTAIWGLMPEQAPNSIRTIGNVDAVEQKIVFPQIDSILRNKGSQYTAVQLLVGDEREKYQEDARAEFQAVLAEKDIELLYGLVRHVYIPEEVREPIQLANIADELTLTRDAQRETATKEAELREAQQQVVLAGRTVEVETEQKVAGVLAEGDRQAQGIRAETMRMVAAIDRQTAGLEAQATRVLGQATNQGLTLIEQSKNDRFRLAVEAFGSGTSYNNWTFASNLPDDVQLNLMYAGQGTLWTDMNGAGGNTPDFGVRATLPLETGNGGQTGSQAVGNDNQGTGNAANTVASSNK